MLAKISPTVSSEVIRIDIDIDTSEHATSLANYLEHKKVGIVTQITIFPNRGLAYILIRPRAKGTQAITEIRVTLLDFNI